LRTGIATLLSRRVFVGLLALAWLPFVVRAVQIYAAANFPQADFLAPTRETFRLFLEQQNPFVFFIAVYAGAGLIANDRRANALQIYLSRPLTRAEYVFGKLAILLACVLFVTWAPAILLLLVQVLLAGSFVFVVENMTLFPAVTVFSLIQAFTVSLTMLALSSLSKSSRYVGVLYAGVMFFSQALYGVVYAITRNSQWAWIALPNDLAKIGDVVFRLPSRYDVPFLVAVLVVCVVIVGAGVILERRVRGVEVVA
jgi:ABC-2 type transport system permease protein